MSFWTVLRLRSGVVKTRTGRPVSEPFEAEILSSGPLTPTPKGLGHNVLPSVPRTLEESQREWNWDRVPVDDRSPTDQRKLPGTPRLPPNQHDFGPTHSRTETRVRSDRSQFGSSNWPRTTGVCLGVDGAGGGGPGRRRHGRSDRL